MKIYISADIEGICGVTNWNEANPEKSDYSQFKEQMTAEVNAVCEAALEAGAKEIFVKDAHEEARNIIHSKLPKEVKLIRGWTGGPFMMIDELNDTFDAAIFIGYHAKAGSGANPLSHTWSNSTIFEIKINNMVASEFLINSYICGLNKVPVVLVSGDEGLCEEVKIFNKTIETVAVKKGVGSATVNIHPEMAIKIIKDKTKKILKSNFSKCKINMPKNFNVEVTYKDFKRAYSCSFYPGVYKIDDRTLGFKSNDYYEVLRCFNFIL